MPSFDVVSKVVTFEVTNAVDQANREIQNRFDFKDTNAHFEFKEDKLTSIAPNRFQLEQMQAVLYTKLAKRGVNSRSLEKGTIQESLHEARQELTLCQGLEQELAKKIVKLIKDGKWKVQSSIMGDHIRITGKNKDDLQEVIALLRKTEFERPLQFENFRD